MLSDKAVIVFGDKLAGFVVRDTDEKVLMIKIDSLFFIGFNEFY